MLNSLRVVSKSPAFVQRTSGTFIWESTAPNFIDGKSAGYALNHTALQSSGTWDDRDFVDDFLSVGRLTLVARDPLSSSPIDLSLFCFNNYTCALVILLLGCVLQEVPTVRFLYSCFADFLTTPSRRVKDIWTLGRDCSNQTFALKCMFRLVLKRHSTGE